MITKMAKFTIGTKEWDGGMFYFYGRGYELSNYKELPANVGDVAQVRFCTRDWEKDDVTHRVFNVKREK